MTPRRLHRTVATIEALTWAGLLGGMAVKYLLGTTDVGVTVFGPIHGVAFIGYCLATVVVAVDQRWSTRHLAVGLLSAVPPFATLPFEAHAVRRGLLTTDWRLAIATPAGLPERLTAWLVRRPGQGLAVGAATVAVLTAGALLAGPPVG